MNILTNKKDEIKRPLILDGAVGSYLHQLGVEPYKAMWLSGANITEPEQVIKMHRDYINSGADIITTNTFRTNPIAFEESNISISYSDLIRRSIDYADIARDGEDVIIAGSNAPAEDCYQKERTLPKNRIEYNHKKHIELLWENGCDFILNETFSHLDEINIVSEFCSNNNIPFITSLFVDENLNILSGEDIATVLELIKSYSPLSFSFNCIKPSTFEKAIDKLQPDNLNEFGYYLNCGDAEFTNNKIKCAIDENKYLDINKKFIEHEPLFIGGCCGTTPKHIETLRNYLSELY